jgi:hypothetical protein
MAREIQVKLREHFPKELAHTTLGFSVVIDEAQSRAKTIFEYAPRSRIGKAMASLAEELIARAPLENGR